MRVERFLQILDEAWTEEGKETLSKPTDKQAEGVADKEAPNEVEEELP